VLGFPLAAGESAGGDELARVLRAAREGDAAAFEAIVRLYEIRVARTALRLLGDRRDAQDAAQEVFLKLHQRIGRIDDAGTLGGWLYRVTVNACYDILRRRRPGVALEDAGLAVASGVEGELQREEQRRLIAAAMAALPGKERAALALRDIEGLTTREVAEILGSSEATVRSQISAARLKIRKYLRRRT
jgi:RNA polymerase sigma-70 factor (ECF subfamily)